jgi:hypothetical protein
VAISTGRERERERERREGEEEREDSSTTSPSPSLPFTLTSALHVLINFTVLKQQGKRKKRKESIASLA